MNLHILKGCAPMPLAHYLKALGILRLVGEQADKQARGWWDGEYFCLLTKLSKEELEKFLLEEYEPTAMIAPWNGGSGFFQKDNREAITSIKESKANRMRSFCEGIKQAEGTLNGLTVKPDQKQKPHILRRAVLEWRGSHRQWLEAAYVLDEFQKPIYPSLLGTGGNDGRLDFTQNYMQQLGKLFNLSSEAGSPTPVSRELLINALWTEPTNKLEGSAIGQYHPSSAGGANSSTGFASGNLVNPWDFVLMMEGALLFTSRATKRFDPNAISRASAPFSVLTHAAGYATPGSEKAQRGEQWMPLWKQPAILQDVKAMYGEARCQLDRQTVSRPVDMARAISRLGVARGIESFVRYGYLERNGQSTLAVPLGRVHVRYYPRAHLVDDLAGWADRIRKLSRDRNAPARLVQAERRLAEAVFAALTHDHTPDRWQAILLAAADIESLQATGIAVDEGRMTPIPPLRPEWVASVEDQSVELRLALALGSTAAFFTKERQPVDPIRHHWLPLDELNPRKFGITDKKLVNDPRVVAFGRDPLRDLAAIVERRLIEAGMKGQRRLPLVAAAGCGARLDDLARFLTGSVDYNKLLGLARAFMAIKWDQWGSDHCPTADSSADIPEEAWLATRLANLAFPLSPDKTIPAEPCIVRLLMSGQTARAIEIARSRLKSSGIRPPLQCGVTDPATAKLWAAALAFPITRASALECVSILDPSKKGETYGRSYTAI